jgi:hypothetical protein
MSLIVTGLLANHKQEADVAFLKSLAEAAGAMPIRELVQRFAAYNGILLRECADIIFETIREACRRDSLADPATAVSMSGRIHDELLARLRLDEVKYFLEGPAQPEATCRLLDPCANAYRSDELARPILRRLGEPNCPALDFHAASGATLFVGPCDFQLFAAQGYYIPGATARPHATTILATPGLTIDRPVVLIQDIFNGFNFAHFLLDWLTRLAIFTMRGPVPATECLFVFGGIPGEFHRIVLDAARRLLDLEEENFFFPTDNVLIRSSQYIGYFSDQCTDISHPAQMFRPEAKAWIDRLTGAIASGAETGHKKLYISRGDVGRRAVANEAQLFDSLEPRGFEFVRLGDLPVADQLSVMRSADTIVAAHGMGLTYVALHKGPALNLIELHNPFHGTDAYAFVCKGKGFIYLPVIGEVVSGASDFRVDTGQVARLLDGAHSPVVAYPAPQGFSVGPRGPDWYPGCQSTPAVITTEIAPPMPGSAVFKHLRDAADRVHDTNVGWWHIAGLYPLKVYTFSCRIFIPEAFRGGRVTLSVGEPRERAVEADLSCRGAWQLVSMTLMLPRDPAEWNLVLRVNSDTETVLYSSGWSVDQAPIAGAHPGVLESGERGTS